MTCFADTLPLVASGRPSRAGRVFQLVVFSGHVSLVIGRMLPPAGLPSLLLVPTVRRTTALSTAILPRPWTTKRSSPSRAGAPLTRSPLAVPYVFVGVEASAYVS